MGLFRNKAVLACLTALCLACGGCASQLSGNYELVWDRETCQYVMRPIDNGQTSLFDKDKPSDGDAAAPAGLPAAQASLPPAGEVIDADYQVVGEEEPKKQVTQDAFDWLRQFAVNICP